MPCPSSDQLKQLALTGTAKNLAEIEAHLDDCKSCQCLLEQFLNLASEHSLWQTHSAPDRPTLVASESDELIGAELDGYLIIERAGTGGSGTVYKAIQEATDRVVAIKVMAGQILNDKLVKTWRRESRLVARIKHANVISILDAGRSSGYEYCVFEWVDGGSLADQLKRSQLEVREAARIALAVSKGCSALHQKRIVHRDIKPSNILLDPEGRVKLADLGIAQALDETTTMQGSGTPGFMSPEQLGVVACEVDERTDVYSIGAVIYAMLVGRGPFPGSNALEVMSNAAEHEIRAPSCERSVPRDLETICLKCLEKKPAARYEEAVALASDLERFLAGEPILARPPTFFSRAKKWMRTNVRTLAALTFLAIVLFSYWIGQAIRSREAQLQIARERLTRVLEVDASGLPGALERFKDLSKRNREQILRGYKVKDSVQSQLRLLLGSDASNERLLAFVSQNASELPVGELAAVFIRLNHPLEPESVQPMEFPRSLREALNSKASVVSETELIQLALAASVAPEELSPTNVQRVVRGLQGNGKLHSSVWTAGFASIAANLCREIRRALRGKENLNRNVLVDYGFAFGLASTQPGRAELIAQVLLLCPADKLIEFANRLPPEIKNDVAKELRSYWFESSQMDREAKARGQQFPKELTEIHRQLRQYHAFCTKDVLLLPAVPIAEWKSLAKRLVSSDWFVIEIRPTVIEGAEFVAVTLQKGKKESHDITIDLHESKVESLCSERAKSGDYPISVWARPVSNKGNFDELLVTIVWGQSEHPHCIRFDERPIDWGIDVQDINRNNYYEANRFFLLELGVHEDIEATQAAASEANLRDRLEIEPIMTAQRTIGLIREGIQSDQAESREADLRMQSIARTDLPTNETRVLERNFKFQARPRKLSLVPSPPLKHRVQCERLLQLGFLPESCCLTSNGSGEFEISSRWSTGYSLIKPQQHQSLAAAVLGCFLLGESAPLTDAFSFKLDPTVASLVSSFGAHLQPRHASAIARELRKNHNATVLYSLVLLASYMPRSAITVELKEELDRLAKTSNHAGVRSALNMFEGIKFETVIVDSADEVEAPPIDGTLIVELSDQPMVQIVPKEQLQLLVAKDLCYGILQLIKDYFNLAIGVLQLASVL